MSPSQADQLVAMALERYEFHVSTDGAPFVVPTYGSSIARTLRGQKSSVRSELAAEYHKAHGKVPSSNALREALDVIEGQCHHMAQMELHLRLARVGGEIYVDLGTPDVGEEYCFVKIGQGAWEPAPIAPVLFRRTALTSPMPRPVSGGNVDDLRGFVNLDDKDFQLWVAWIIAAFFADIPHPVLVVRGAQGTGKSTLVELTVDLIDPSPAPLRTAPRTSTDFSVSASASWCVAFDNLSGLPDWLSDSLCRTVTGDGLVRRKLYTDGDVAVDSFRRVVILNGIDPGVVRGDLIDRSVFIELDQIAASDRVLDRALKRDFQRARPEILGALLEVTAMTLTTLSAIHLDSAPRMADFAQILAAIDHVLGWHAYETYIGKAQNARMDAIEANPVAGAIVALMGQTDVWTGTATDLLAEICPDPLPRTWPQTARSLSVEVTRVESALMLRGIEIERQRTSGERIIEIKNSAPDASSTSSASPSVAVDAPVSVQEGLDNIMEMFPEADVVE